MDKSKQPGISFDGMILVKESFWRDLNVPDESKISLNIDMSTNLKDKNSTTQLSVDVIMKYDDTEVLKLETSFVGLFSIDEDAKNMEMEKFLKSSSPAIMFPFIREHIATISQKAGVGPILLPPVNILALINQGEE